MKKSRRATCSVGEIMRNGTEITPDKDSAVMMRNAGSWAVFNKTGDKPREFMWELTKSVSPDIKGPGTISIGYSANFSYTANINLSWDDKV
ncbi:hypothetical protein O6R05_01880 [Peptoniphilus equinus]|uniref:Uncharacterized protein n=1 Tax=Peptoniphilus equinus TaxID=3016343 RepID=A0ABY7QU54_9FIRM|nr:hypothetical protein [Peptoniphilus equinus]WBW50315.1 hypothetical protein O6R05_01880 [Peptoniphilus equinus]